MSLVVSAASSVWLKKKVRVSASSTLVVDSFSYSNLTSAHYITQIREVSGDKAKSFHYQVQKGESGLSDVVYAKHGDSITIGISASNVSGQYQLSIQNDEIYDIDVSMARLVLD